MELSLDGALPGVHAHAESSDRLLPYVVGIGASAGGLEALERFFEKVPIDAGIAFVVVQHLSPDFKSLMDEILSRRTGLPIDLVEDGVQVEPNHIYLIPPKKEMIIAGGRLLLSEKRRDHDLSLPIDVFFRSLAQECGSRGIAIVLSGGGSDGSRGIRAVHEAGGLVIVQDVDSAQFDGMPKTARDAGVADYVLPPHEMPRVLLEHLHRARSESSPGLRVPELGMASVYRMLEHEFGIDFTHYKPSTVTRRIERRLQLAHMEDLDEYVRRLKAEREELDVLYRDLLIGVTRFFRNEEAFQLLEQRVLPELFAHKLDQAPLRLWVAGCATGEEVYSLAIALHELMQRVGERPVKIFATDVHRGSIERATRALYDEQAVANVSPERLERYFVRRGLGFQVAPEIRQMAVFAVHNVIKDAPFTRVDFVSCRNMLIYLQPAVQQKVLGMFHFALNREGILFLGPSESPGPLLHAFETVDKRWRLYRKYHDRRLRSEPKLTIMPRPANAATPLSPSTSPSLRPSSSSLLGTYDALLDEFVPPSLLVNEQGELLHAFAGASRFLKPRDGRQGLDLLEMLAPDLKLALLGTMRRAFKQSESIAMNGVRAAGDEVPYRVTLRRIQGRGGAAPHVLITFTAQDGEGAQARVEAFTELELHHASREQLGALEAELSYTKENLQAATEELETSNEELQAANEELLASNEELQSTNEELQSVNEELYSVNAEYQRKIADLTELGNDMENLLASTDVGTIFLDPELRIRKFTEQLAKSFNLLPQDIGRPIAAFSNTIDYPQLSEDLKSVLAHGVPIEREVRDGHNRASFLRILPYRAKGRVDGVVLTLIDVSGLKTAEDALFHERYLLNSLLASVPDAIYFKDARGKFIRANEAMAARLGLDDPKQAVGKTGFELSSHKAALAMHQQDEFVLHSGQAQHYVLEKRALEGGSEAWDLVTRLPLHDGSGGVVGIIGIFRDVTEQKRAEETIQEAVRRRDQFLAMLSHELRNPLGAIVAATALLKNGAAGSEKQPKLLDILTRQSQQMARLLDDLLEVSRVTQDKIELRREIVDLCVVIREAADAARGMMEARGIQFDTEICDTPLYVDADAPRLQQVQANLLNNAAKYTPRGGHVSLQLRREGSEAVITVRDDGVGIPRALLPSVFDLFVQSSRTLDRSDGGLGVGLTLVRGLVRKHGGEVRAQSGGEGEGSEFVVRLPLAPVEPEQPESGPANASVRRQHMSRVVIVEDNPDSREMLCELLEAAGFCCKTADSGLKGLALLDEVHPDIALVDIGLPEIDGFEFARRVRANPSQAHIYLVALTGYGQREDREKALRAGFDRHLVKPIDPTTLIALLSDASGAERGRPADDAEA